MTREGRRNALDRRWRLLHWRTWVGNRRSAERRTGFDRRVIAAVAY